MELETREKIAIAVLAGLLVLAGLVLSGMRPQRTPAEAGMEAEISEEAEPVRIYVHVAGSVESPGLYELPAGARVNDAIAAAGGPSEGADTNRMNLASPLRDGQRVYVPNIDEGEDGTSPGVVRINQASVAELSTLPGIGQSLATRIVAYREANGPFSDVNELVKVSGIGTSKLQQIMPLITLD